MSDPFRTFVEQMARLTTPYDPKELAKLAADDGWDIVEFLTDDDKEDLVAGVESDKCFEDAMAFWKLIKQARELVGS